MSEQEYAGRVTLEKGANIMTTAVQVVFAAQEFKNFFKRKYEGQEIQCPYIRELFAALDGLDDMIGFIDEPTPKLSEIVDTVSHAVGLDPFDTIMPDEEITGRTYEDVDIKVSGVEPDHMITPTPYHNIKMPTPSQARRAKEGR